MRFLQLLGLLAKENVLIEFNRTELIILDDISILIKSEFVRLTSFRKIELEIKY